MHLSSSRERFNFELAASPSRQALFVSCQLFPNHCETSAFTQYKGQAGVRGGELLLSSIQLEIRGQNLTSGGASPMCVSLPWKGRGVEGRWSIYDCGWILAHISTVSANSNESQKSLLPQTGESWKNWRQMYLFPKECTGRSPSQLAQAADTCSEGFIGPCYRWDRNLLRHNTIPSTLMLSMRAQEKDFLQGQPSQRLKLPC